jgi:hypothetical protein
MEESKPCRCLIRKLGTAELSVLEGCRGGGKSQRLLAFFVFFAGKIACPCLVFSTGTRLPRLPGIWTACMPEEEA